ncbi:unnamed protein product [Polarella glacialis]|uniref:CBM20 domain-containing protein n=1 Tax=Polarella glacialis TaxID=89957 RepID=A0A813JJT1_POLGL|nr:unnamed protein product [Polarella glacialis]
MPVHFRVRVSREGSPEAAAAAAEKGAVLCVCGASPALGAWDPKRSPKLTRSSDSLWEGALEESVAAPGAEYKYVVLNLSKNQYVWESKCQHVMPAAGTQVVIEQGFDSADAPTPREPAGPYPQDRPPAAPKEARGAVKQKLALKVDKQAVAGGHVVVCGEGPALGDWNVGRAFSMRKVQDGPQETWAVELTLVPGVQFKYVIVGGPQGTKWEDQRPNRIFEEGSVGSEGAFHIFDDGASAVAKKVQPANRQGQKTTPTAAPSQVAAAIQTAAGAPAEQTSVELPDWARSSVWYQVYPLGFFGCKLDNNHTEETTARLATFEHWCDYLVELGIGVVLFNPVFESDTHGYDTTDYYQIDRRLGGVDSFRAIVKMLQGRNIRVVLDGVFNHTGRSFFAFQDCLKNGLSSQYASWFYLRPGQSSMGDPFQYDSWEGHLNLPKLNHSSPEVRRYIFDVARYWLSEIGIDGWRLDVAHEIAPEFWREFHQECLAARKDMCLLGELMHGDYRMYVKPGVLHSGTNYQLSKALWSSLNDANYFELVHSIERCASMYQGMTLLEFLGNHDVTRLFSKLKVKQHFELAQAALLLGIGGMPCLYYGDEYGMEGHCTKEGGAGNDADVRRVPPKPDALDAASRKRFDAVAHLLSVRCGYASLSKGTTHVLGNTNEQMVLCRQHEGSEYALVIFNSASRATDSVLPGHVQPKSSLRVPEHLVFERVCCFADGERMLAPMQATLKSGKPIIAEGLRPNSVSVFISKT